MIRSQATFLLLLPVALITTVCENWAHFVLEKLIQSTPRFVLRAKSTEAQKEVAK